MIVFPHNDRPLNDDAVHEVMMEEAERIANGERIVLARTIRRAITSYLDRTVGMEDAELRWTDVGGFLRNRDGLPICGAYEPHEAARCIREPGHVDTEGHIFRDRVIK